MKNETCEWKEDCDAPHETQCDNLFEFTNDGVKENKFKFCPYCGGEIKLTLVTHDDE